MLRTHSEVKVKHSLPAIFLVALGLLLPTVSAGQGFQPVSPDELKMTAEPQAPGAKAIILQRRVDRDDNIHTPHEYAYFRIKILKEDGLSLASIEIPFDKEYEDVVNIHGRTVRPDGSIANFDGKVYEKWIVKGRGVRYQAKTFTLPDVQVGGIIEYFYTIDLSEHYIFDSHWILSHDLFTRNAQFSLKPFKSDYATYTLRWTWQGLPAGIEPKAGADSIVRMEVNNIPAFQTEDYMPPPNELKMRVDFIYDEDLAEKDPVKFWKRIGKKRNDALEAFIGKRRAMEEAVAQVVSAGDPPETKLRKIYDRVQKIRNTSYEVRKTEAEEKRAKEKRAENVEEIWKRGYGDGMQLTWLFLALARAAGFEAYGCWVSDRREYFFTPTTMQSEKLNANVVLVKLNGKDLYLDPGAAFTPFGLLTWHETGTPGLRLDKDGGTWIRTTLPESAESQVHRAAEFKLTETGDLEGKVTATYTGLEAMYPRLELRHDDEVARKKFLEDQIKEQIPAATEVELKNQPDWNNAQSSLVAEFEVRIPGWAATAGRRVVMPVGIFAEREKHLFEHANRVHPIYVEYPFESVDDITLQLPPGWQTSTTPRSNIEDGHIVKFSMQFEDKHAILHFTRTLDVDFLIIEQKYYTALRNFFQVVRTADEQQIVIQPGSANASR